MSLPRLALTAGEPAGIGPELVARLAASDLPADLVAIADPALLAQAARAAGIELSLRSYDGAPVTARARGELRVVATTLSAAATPGRLDPRNAPYVLATLARAADGAGSGEFAAIVTAPVHKGVINDAGIPFTGHTEFFAARAGRDVVMMLTAPGGARNGGDLRVALATTHLPLAAVPAAITRAGLVQTLRILCDDLIAHFRIAAPRIAVLGLNPHAGEGGHLGREEIDVIAPAIGQLRAAGFDVQGPIPADTAFVPTQLQRYDAVLAMYHDQGLPVLKHAGFGHAVNVTLGLPYLRTSVDHGTALDLAGTGRADPGSLFAAARLALALARS
ncbi:4-hydroxythreonine-4-phosphate dehydrogenase PdxA [Dokdonella fugitiva]|uniref:4-hydroxythreonine-4-phosphate dehydrogenase n=1 Tax=Dokdonella fugitiva TaxID=328517 RepID=A0A4V2S2X0_9GAMM|nr:4-hydroxythreonine-4-phosphate dehydrogenase PdxA [Dokdonella fugitiva]TCO42100.1 4-hydroxythreonine-4-phosphate dehydrogenase [Dokdonella fugitiva]